MTALDGHLDLRAELRVHGQTVLVRQGFTVPFHLSKPYWDPDHGVLIVQVANPTAGILAGDRLTSRIEVASGAKLCVTTPSASRVFRMNSGEASAEQSFHVEAEGWLEVMPEPLVLHRHSRYRQSTSVNVASGGGLFFADQLVPGRVGHGEIWAWDELALDLRLKVDGKLTLVEHVGQNGSELQALARSVGFGEMAAFANAVLVEPSSLTPSESPSWRDEIRLLHQNNLWCGASEITPGVWSLRLIGRDGVALRHGMTALRRVLAITMSALRCDLRKL